MTMFRPSIRGGCSIWPTSLTSSASRIRRSRPRSGCRFSLPRNMIVTLTFARRVEEADDVALLRLVVVDSDLRSELDLLDVDLRLVLPRDLRLLFLLVAVLPVVHHPRDGRICLRRHLDEVEIAAVGVLARLVGRLDPDLLSVLADEPHLRYANLVVDPLVLDDGTGPVLRTPPGSQRLLTKLCLSSKPCCSSLQTSKAADMQRHRSLVVRLG